MATASTQRQTTLLQVLIHERHLTRERTIDVLDRRAVEMGANGFALTVRQLNRWLAGEIETEPRPAVCEVVEAEFGAPIGELLGPYDDSGRHARTVGRRQAASARTQLRTEPLVAWLADHCAPSFEEVWVAVAEIADQLEATPRRDQAAHQHRRDVVPRDDIASAVASYYQHPDELYRVRVGEGDLDLTILTRPDWTGLGIPLGQAAEQTSLAPSAMLAPPHLEGIGLDAAVARLAEVEVNDTTLVNNDLYGLADLKIQHDRLTARFALSDFASYALTGDLLEEELVDTLAGHTTEQPLRDLCLPDTDAALRFQGRCCAGGPVCLLAIARPEGDYALLVQERSTQVVNMPGRLAVIPKAFHQPLVDAGAETRLAATVMREFEEELLGRQDLEHSAPGSRRQFAPSHPLNRTEPLAWLCENADWSLECTGFGVNLVTGNYEFACLMTIDDERWWEQFGHRVSANWEAMSVRCWSSREADGLARLAADPRWSNEGLFALVEGLRRLNATGSSRVDVPTIQPRQ